MKTCLDPGLLGALVGILLFLISISCVFVSGPCSAAFFFFSPLPMGRRAGG